MLYEDIKVGDLVWLKESAVSYDTPSGSGVIEGYEKYLERPCKITNKYKKCNKNNPKMCTEFTIDDKFGTFAEDIKLVLTPEDYPEYYI